MDLRELRYFLAVYETGSVTAAARRCFVSQPSISAAIAALEAELKTTLFVRHRKGAAPTVAADALHARARRLVDEAAALRTLFDPPATTTVTLGVMRSLDVPRALKLVQPLTERADVQLSLVDAEETCDARIVSQVSTRPDEAFVTLWSERYVLALPPRHDLALRPRLAMADLKGLRMIARCHCEYADLAATLGFAPEVAAIAASEEWAIGLVEAGVGATVLPEGVAPTDGRVAVRPITDLNLSREVGVAFRAAAAATPAVRHVVEALTGGSARRTSRAVARDRAA